MKKQKNQLYGAPSNELGSSPYIFWIKWQHSVFSLAHRIGDHFTNTEILWVTGRQTAHWIVCFSSINRSNHKQRRMNYWLIYILQAAKHSTTASEQPYHHIHYFPFQQDDESASVCTPYLNPQDLNFSMFPCTYRGDAQSRRGQVKAAWPLASLIFDL